MNIFELLNKAVELKASDLHLTVGTQPVVRINGSLLRIGDAQLSSEDTTTLINQLLTQNQLQQLNASGELDFAYSSSDEGRFRVNAFKQNESYALAIRIISSSIYTIDELGLPSILKELSMKRRGLILVTGPTGSGKTTTLASMLDYINKNRQSHILTLEDPIEYQHKHNKSIINQREIGRDSNSFGNALRAALRQDPDVILVGEMRDLETIGTALTAAETGHLVLSTLHTVGAAKTIDRITDVFPPYQQQQIRVQLATVLEAIISQQLLPTIDGNKRVAAQEIMIANPAVKNLIREGKAFQIQNLIQTGSKLGMKSMDYSLSQLYKQQQISKQTAIENCIDRDMLERLIIGS